MASGITTAQQLQDVLDAIHDNISQMDVYTGLSELGSLRLCWNDISRTATIFKRINEEEEREEVVCTFNPENIVIGTDTFQGKMLKNIVHNATTTVTRSNDVGLGGYVGLKTLIRNICAALGVNLASNFDEINPTIYGELVNIVKKYYGDSLQNNAPYGLARKDTTSGGTTTTTYNSYIPVMIIVDIAIYLNGIGVFNSNTKKPYQPLCYPQVGTNDITKLKTFDNYYNFLDKTQFKDFFKDWIKITWDSALTLASETINSMYNLYEQEFDFENCFVCCTSSANLSTSYYELKFIFIPKTCKVTTYSSGVYGDFRNGSNTTVYYYNDNDFYITTFDVVHNTDGTYTNNKTVTEKTKETLYHDVTKYITNIACDMYIKPYYLRNTRYHNRFNTTDSTNVPYEFIDSHPNLSYNTMYNLSNLHLLNSDTFIRLLVNYEALYLLDNNIEFDDNTFFVYSYDNTNRVINMYKCNPNSVKLTTTGARDEAQYFRCTNVHENYIVCRRYNENVENPYTLYEKPYLGQSTSSTTYTYTFDSEINITVYSIDNNNVFSQSTVVSDNISVTTRSPIFSNIGELVEIQETDALEGITLQDNATYPSQVIDYNSFNTTYPDWGKIGYSQPYFEEDQIAGTYTAQWAAISVDTDTPTSQADSQAGEIDFTDTDLVDDIIDDIDNADDGNDEEEVDPNSDEIEGEGETPDDELDRIEPNVLTGGFVKQYALTAAQMRELATCLTNPDLLQTVVRAFRDPMQAIVSLQLAYKTPTLTSPTDIILYGFDWSSLTNKPKGYPLATNIINFDFGTLHIDPLYNTYQDITTTSIELYLPCVGFIPLNPAEFLDRGLDVEGKIDTLSGTIVYDISAYDGTKRKLLYQKTGNCQLQLPISSNDNSTIFGALMGVGGMALGGFTGNPLLMAQGAAMTGASMAQGPNYEHGGSISANAGLMTKMIPCVIIKRNQVYNPTHLNELHGLPANSYVKLGSCSGYTVVQDVKVDIQGATQSEKSQIETLLKGGVIL